MIIYYEFNNEPTNASISHLLLSERGSPGVTASSKHQPLDSPPDQRPLRHVAH